MSDTVSNHSAASTAWLIIRGDLSRSPRTTIAIDYLDFCFVILNY